MLESYFIVLMLGVFYGFFVGLIPAAGATTGLIAIYSFVTFFQDPYMLVVFTTAIIVTSSIGDSFFRGCCYEYTWCRRSRNDGRRAQCHVEVRRQDPECGNFNIMG